MDIGVSFNLATTPELPFPDKPVPASLPSNASIGGEVTDEPRIPMEFLKKLFGSEVENALKTLKDEMDKKAKGEKSELMDILIAYKHSEMFKI